MVDINRSMIFNTRNFNCFIELMPFYETYAFSSTIDSKMTRSLEKIRIKKSDLMQFSEINICQVINCRPNTVYNKIEMIKIDNQSRKNHKYYHK